VLSSAPPLSVLALIHRSAWKWNSAKIALMEFSEAGRIVGTCNSPPDCRV
jgi:hypothetical protein